MFEYIIVSFDLPATQYPMESTPWYLDQARYIELARGLAS
jgi:hypothetical protein